MKNYLVFVILISTIFCQTTVNIHNQGNGCGSPSCPLPENTQSPNRLLVSVGSENRLDLFLGK